MLIQEIIGAFTGQNQRDKKKATMNAALFGLAAGALAGILLAPHSGKETRQIIADKSVEGAKAVKDVSLKAADKVRETAHDVKDTVVAKAADVRQAARDARRKARNAGDVLKDGAHDVFEDVKDTAEAVGDELRDGAEDVAEDAKDTLDEVKEDF